MKPHELYDLTNRLMMDLPPDITERELIEIGASFIARGKFLHAARAGGEVMDRMLEALQDAKKARELGPSVAPPP